MRVTYHVALDPARHELRVEIAIEAPPAGELSLVTPTWVPGDYGFETFARDIFEVRAVGLSHDAPLPVRRHGWSGYVVDAGGRSLTVSYRASASSVDFSEECGVLGDTNGVLLGTRYLHVAAHEGSCRVHYQVPAGWAIHHPAGARSLGGNAWDYDSYEQLLDTPVSFGQFDLVTRRVRGTDFHHVFLTRAVGFERGVDRLVGDLVKIAEVYADIFGSFPFEDYTYVLSFNPNDSWGLEHLTGTMIGLDPATFCDEDRYKVSIRVCAHELFHAWNVRRLRPAPLGHLQLERGCFTSGLWVAEGFTRFYEFLSCTRTGVYDAGQFFSAVTNYYTHLAALPAYARVSPADSSYASYLNHPKYPGRANSAIDYYDAGMVIAFETDVALRTGSSGRQSLDTVFAAFYEARVGKGAGYTVDEICTFFGARMAGLEERMRTQALEPGRLELPGQLRALGFEVTESDVPSLGVILQDGTGPRIASVLDDSPAGASGLASEDSIASVNGAPFSAEALAWAAANEEAVVLGAWRGNQPRTYTIRPDTRRTVTGLRWTGSASQAALIAQWLNTAFSPPAGQEFALDFYENFHGIETVI
jgi:predicted metalloprotease with PDZ domain